MAVAGRGTALVNTSYRLPKKGLAASTSLSLYRAAMVGLYEPLMARYFCDSALVMNITRSAAMAGFLEYLDTASCQPPSVAAFWPLAPPLGRADTPILPEILESLALPSDQA
ncbi:hypothetical protein Y695_03197 [Hydrogenophaga sp. T4]|nr:hypothetical protein Y695_03197 [Hydrogenophaga sp. T4]